MKTIRLTMAQALVRFLENQYIRYDGVEHPFVEGVIMLPGHGNVVGLGQALGQEAHRLRPPVQAQEDHRGDFLGGPRCSQYGHRRRYRHRQQHPGADSAR